MAYYAKGCAQTCISHDVYVARTSHVIYKEIAITQIMLYYAIDI